MPTESFTSKALGHPKTLVDRKNALDSRAMIRNYRNATHMLGMQPMAPDLELIKNHSSAIATLIGVVVAIVSLMITLRRQRSLNRTQHTFNALLQTSLNEQYQRHLDRVRPYFRSSKNINDIVESDGELKTSVNFLLYHYEFLAGGVRYGDLSESFLQSDQGHIIRELYKMTRPHIAQWREKAHNPKLFDQIQWLCNRWFDEKPGSVQRFAERIRGRPFFRG